MPSKEIQMCTELHYILYVAIRELYKALHIKLCINAQFYYSEENALMMFSSALNRPLWATFLNAKVANIGS